jgi:uncharacterized membrane protein
VVRKQFSESQQEAIRDAIAAAELNTSGEIRVHIDKVCKKDPIERAIEMFAKLGMHKTELKNGVLFFVSMENHKLAIIGDKGINEAVTADFWDSIRDEMIQHFKQGLYTEGLVNGIHRAGEQLKAAFPFQSDDENELSNDVSFEGEE